ncbi:MAG: hypothetical protein EOO01_11170 [Chitinophagaceae bacterium]|nr:MAG: hypothetical protein EOO01_11170 [Chitinophagaceae bacterium]
MNESRIASTSFATDDDVMENTLPTLAPGEIVLGALVSIDAFGNPLVSYPQSLDKNPVIAITTLAVNPSFVGRQVALLFANGDYRKPIIMGFIYSPLDQLLDNYPSQIETPTSLGSESDQQVFPNEISVSRENNEKNFQSETVHVDGKRVVIEGQEEVVLMCGESSITLTKAGKVIIRGKYLVSRSSGVNRILGGSVQVN